MYSQGYSRGGQRSSGFTKRSGGASSSQGGRRSFGGGGRGSRGGHGGGRRRFQGEHINETKYIRKATARAAEVYASKHTFADFHTHEQLAKNLAALNFVTPTPIQDQAIPVAMSGKDVIGIASTGTGKTAAFLIPIINRFIENRRHMAMVLAPTRELAQQIEAMFKELTKGMKIFSVSCVGGAPIGKQLRELELGVHIVIGTPGRVQDCIERRKIKLEDFHTVVLDEADRMLDMGFVDDMRAILGGMPKERQGMFFSATFSPEIKKLCNDFLKDPVTVSVKTQDTADSVDQDVIRFSDASDQFAKLLEVVRRPDAQKVIIFRETKRSVDQLAEQLYYEGISVMPLHGDMRNRERERAVKALATGDAHVLIATDVAARGIDISDVTHVLNYDLPNNYDTYIHRIGRTGRAQKTGTALTFVRTRGARY